MKKPYITNLVTKSDLYNISSITSTNTLLNKFQICLDKLNNISTKEIAFKDIKILISQNKNNPKALRYYLSSLNIDTKKLTHFAKEYQLLIYGYISEIYQTELYDTFDNSPNLIKTISRMLNQIRSKYLDESDENIQNAAAFSYSEILKYSMPKDDIALIIIVFFDPLINLINSGKSLNIQRSAGTILNYLIDCIGKDEIYELIINNENNNESNILEILSKKILNQFIKGPINDNFTEPEGIYKLIKYIRFENFNFCLKDIYNKLLNILNKKNLNYKLYISVLNIFNIIGEKLLELNYNTILEYFQYNIINKLNYFTKDRIHKIQIAARLALNKWKELEKIYNREEEGKNNIVNNNILKNNKYNFNQNKTNYNIDNKREFNNKKFNKKQMILNNELKRSKTIDNFENFTNNFFIENRENKIKKILDKNILDTNIKNNIKIENFDYKSKEEKDNNNNNNLSIFKLTLSNLLNNSFNQIQNQINDKITNRLNYLDNKINKLEQKLYQFTNKNLDKTESDLIVINNRRIEKNILNSTHIENRYSTIWYKSLMFLEKNQINEAYNLVLKSEDDIYLLRLIFITGPVLNKLNENLAKKVLIRINKINKSQQIQNILINLINQSLIENYNNKKIFYLLNYDEQNDILDSLYNINNFQNDNKIIIRAKELYNKIIYNNKIIN